MKCFNEKMYSAFLDNELNQKKRKDVAAHIESCQSCQKLIEYLRKENQMLKEAFSTSIPSMDITVDIAQRIKFVEAPAFTNGKKFSYSLYAALALSGIILPILFYHLLMNVLAGYSETLSFLFSPIPILFDALDFLKRIILNTSITVLTKYLFFLLVPIMMIIFGISLLFRKGYEPSP